MPLQEQEAYVKAYLLSTGSEYALERLSSPNADGFRVGALMHRMIGAADSGIARQLVDAPTNGAYCPPGAATVSATSFSTSGRTARTLAKATGQAAA